MLRKLARQRVCALIPDPEGRIIWLTERSATYSLNEEMQTDLYTCQMRGWAEPIADAVPAGDLTKSSEMPDPLYNRREAAFRLTEAGWNVIHREHGWLLFTAGAALASAVTSLLALLPR
jgi:hypothetical protein